MSATKIVQRLMWLWVAILSISGAQVAWWALDRSPPFETISVTAQPVRPGGILLIDGKVRRDLDRDCSIVASRYMIDSHGTRHEIMGLTTMTPEALRKMDAMAPGEVHMALRIPDYVPSGRAQMVTALAYSCNPLQDIVRPVNVEMIAPFEVLP